MNIDMNFADSAINAQGDNHKNSTTTRSVWGKKRCIQHVNWNHENYN